MKVPHERSSKEVQQMFNMIHWFSQREHVILMKTNALLVAISNESIYSTAITRIASLLKAQGLS